MDQSTRVGTIKRVGAALGVITIGFGTSIFITSPVHAAPKSPQMVAADSESCFSIPGPAAPGDLAVLNVVITDALGNGYITARPWGSTPTSKLPASQRTANGNFLGHPSDPALRSTDPNMAIVEIGAVPDSDVGAVCIDLTTGSITAKAPAANLVVDYVGYMPVGGGAKALDKQTRLIDTRTDKTPVKSDEVRMIDTVDAADGDAVFVNAVVPNPRAPGYGLVLGEGDTPNNASKDKRSSLNFAVNTSPFNINVNPNTAMAVVGTNKQIGVEPYTVDGSAVDVVVDQLAVVGADQVLPIDPVRVYDARTAGAATTGTPICFGLPSLDEGMTAVVNIAVDTRPKYTGTDGYGWVYLRPAEAPTSQKAPAATANFKPINGGGNIDPNTTLVTLGASKEVCVDGYSGTGTPIYFVVDLLGALEAGTFTDAAETPGGRARLVDTRKGLRLPNLSPPPPGTIEITIRPNADGDDNKNRNDEWVRFTNTAAGPIDMSGWTVEDEPGSDGSEHTFTFENFVLGAGKSVTLYSGYGTNTSTSLYWNKYSTAIWNNEGDTVFLRNSLGQEVETWGYDVVAAVSEGVGRSVTTAAS